MLIIWRVLSNMLVT